MGARYKREVIDTVELEVADTEYEYPYPADATKMHISSRLGAELKFAFVEGDIAAGNYKTIGAGSSGFWKDMTLTDSRVTLYVSSSEANDTLEVLYFQ